MTTAKIIDILGSNIAENSTKIAASIEIVSSFLLIIDKYIIAKPRKKNGRKYKIT